MENSVWRPRAKIIAIVDLVFIILGTLFIIVFMALFTSAVKEVGSRDSDSLNETLQESDFTAGNSQARHPIETIAYTVIYVVIAISLVVALLQVWAAIELLRGSKMGLDAAIALRRANFWKYMTIAMFILSVIGYFIRLNILGLIILVVWRGISFYVVFNFISELQFAVNTEDDRPGSVVVRK